MNELILQTINKPRLRQVKDMTGANSVRTYRNSPSDVALQIRLENRFVQVNVSFEEAKQLAAKLVEVAQFPGPKCTYPDCRCIVSTSTGQPDPVCPRDLS